MGEEGEVVMEEAEEAEEAEEEAEEKEQEEEEEEEEVKEDEEEEEAILFVAPQAAGRCTKWRNTNPCFKCTSDVVVSIRVKLGPT